MIAIRRLLVPLAGLAVLLPLCAPVLRAQVAQVTATVETDPVPSSEDAADDAAIWINPTDAARSTFIGTDKSGAGLAVYDLDGNELQYDDTVRPNNVDLRYGFGLGGSTVDLVGFSNRDGSTIGTYAVDRSTGLVQDVSAGTIELSFSPAGFCFYQPSRGPVYGIVVGTEGEVEQWELFDNGAGRVDGRLVRGFDVGTETESCTADDLLGDLYVSEEPVGIWKYGAEPGDGDARTLVDSSDGSGHLTADVEGLAIYQTTGGGGYLIASSQGSDEFVVYERRSGGYLGTFEIVDGSVDGVSNTDGIDVTNAPLGSGFERGLFVAQDGDNPGANQNFKLVPWERIANAFDPALEIDTDFDPRGDGGGSAVVEVRIARSSDDAEERRSGAVNLSSADLDLVEDRGRQTVGLRFTDVEVPRGARIVDAFVQFVADEVSRGAVSIAIEGQAANDARAFATRRHDLSSRTTTVAEVTWSPRAWERVGASGARQRTRDLASIIQEIVDRPGWSAGNAIVLIFTGSGTRVTESFDGDRQAAPVLHVEYR